MIEARELRKEFNGSVVLDDVSFTVRPGVVTGFLGPNGAGKTTTMRIIAGLDEATAGQALVDGVPFTEHPAPMSALGVLLEAGAMHRERSARRHLKVLAATNGVPTSNVDQTLDLVGLSDVADNRIGAFSLGMSQRLGLASALLGNPAAVMLDEPLNGLDPDGILWMRELLSGLASQGRTVFLSSHLMSEMSMTAEHLIVIDHGRLLADESIEQFVTRVPSGVRVRSPQAVELREVVRRLVAEQPTRHPDAPKIEVELQPDGTWLIRGIDSATVGEATAHAGITLHELSPVQASLEEAFMRLTAAPTHG